MGLDGNVRKERELSMYKYHEKVIQEQGNDISSYIPKMQHYRKGAKAGSVKIIELFASDLKRVKKNGVMYTEAISSSWVPESVDRTLYKWVYDSSYDFEITPDEKYILPMDHLQEVIVASEIKTFTLEPPTKNEDCPISDAGLRDLVAVNSMVPVSNKVWLNELIIYCNAQNGKV